MAGQIKSKQRVADHGEVFTNDREVNAMLDLVKQETERIDSRFLEPACGDGNFLAEVLRRKLRVVRARYGKSVADYEKYAFTAVASIYGVELLHDNAQACRERLFSIVQADYQGVCGGKPNERFLGAVRYVIGRNILCGNALSLKEVDADQRDTGTPIVFSEWSMAVGDKVKRRDYRLDELLEGNVGQGETMSLFGDEFLQDGDVRPRSEWEFDEETQAYIPLPIQEYPLVSFYEVGGHE